ncbi:hypothetical protein HUK38_05470 [Thiospirillum jenense]|uniref:Uncharacterized protein n=1 Tax=Thiospirillum jenense TaxID=1653858 RepID=A0A839H8C9_9GAMM|nr:hypothetical protein [Thiospirillum jenense]
MFEPTGKKGRTSPGAGGDRAVILTAMRGRGDTGDGAGVFDIRNHDCYWWQMIRFIFLRRVLTFCRRTRCWISLAI